MTSPSRLGAPRLPAKRPDPLKDRPTEDQQIDVLQALRTAPDHMLAITAEAYVDYALEMVIRERFRIDKDEDARIFDGAQNGFLSTVSSKITIAYAARFLETMSRDDLRSSTRSEISSPTQCTRLTSSIPRFLPDAGS